MAATATLRWGMFRSIAKAIRRSTRPGAPGLAERLAAVPRLARARIKGEYTGVSGRELLLLAGALLYVISPVDLMPEALFGLFGLGDDAVVVAWIAAALIHHTDDFLEWERRRAQTIPGQVIG
ncbi:MAG TPA: YkvA family protein [Segeticoccus sp.]|uniref:YkvA family protein n=1 Tax=Segeticoccus sp. TaxID=2706531 RepID=UPI002D7F05D8|nr:YkvA family protein [Segeticoccus sp.]HET8602080.1 YkvA family protein [Segeticoccus sp.]